MVLPPLLVRNVVENWPAVGAGWLDRLPALIGEICAEWGLTVTRLHRMTFHWVAGVRQGEREAVLKLGVPDDGHLRDEAEALRIFDGVGAVRLLAEDAARGALLLENAVPGTPLAATTDDVTATGVLLRAGRRIHRTPAAGCTLPHVRTERAAFGGYLRRYAVDGPMPRRLVERAAALFDDLCATSPGDVVLHGDLHHENVLRAGREPWLVIDPFGRTGDPGWDVGAMLYNPFPERRDPALLDLVPARIEQLSDVADPDRVVAWGFVVSALSEVWSVMSNGGVNTRALDVATLLGTRLA